MLNYTPEETERWTRLMAEVEGLQYLEDNLWTYGYHNDLNALARVARKIADTTNGVDGYRSLHWALYEAYHHASPPVSDLIWQACLTAEELFQIIGRTLDKLKENEDV